MVFLYILAGFTLILLLALTCINLKHRNINSQLRLKGFLYDLILKADDEVSPVKLSKASEKI